MKLVGVTGKNWDSKKSFAENLSSGADYTPYPNGKPPRKEYGTGHDMKKHGEGKPYNPPDWGPYPRKDGRTKEELDKIHAHNESASRPNPTQSFRFKE